MASQRNPIRADTLQAVAAEYAGQPIDEDQAKLYLDYMEPICEMFSGLRKLPLKDVEPAIVFRPVVTDE